MKSRALRLVALLSVGLFALIGVVGAGAFVLNNEPLPVGVADEAADALATKMILSVDADAWQRTAAITWTFAGQYNHLWDRDRHFVRVRKGGWEALVDLNRVKGIASVDGLALTGADEDAAVAKAFAMWANDSFWLAAMNKAFDPGTTRSRVQQPDGSDALLVAYSSGGVTPGDAYLWHLDDNGRPVSWQMWVSIIPVGGVSTTWADWVQLPTGAWVATAHSIGPIDIRITDLDGAESLAGLEPGLDPFAALLQTQGQ